MGGNSSRDAGSAVLARAVLAASVLQVLAPAVTILGPGASPASGSGPELLIAPVGWAFSIWGLIYALAIAQAVASLVTRGQRVTRRLQIDQLALYLGGTLWIVLAAFDSSIATAAALLLMVLAAVDGMLTLARTSIEPGWLSLLTRSALGLYAGWVTAAFFVNLATALVATGALAAGEAAWQVVVLVVAAVVLVGVLVAARGVPAYAAGGTWALAAVAVTAGGDGTTTVLVVSVVGALVLVAVTAALWLTGRAGQRQPQATALL